MPADGWGAGTGPRITARSLATPISRTELGSDRERSVRTSVRAVGHRESLDGRRSRDGSPGALGKGSTLLRVPDSLSHMAASPTVRQRPPAPRFGPDPILVLPEPERPKSFITPMPGHWGCECLSFGTPAHRCAPGKSPTRIARSKPVRTSRQVLVVGDKSSGTRRRYTWFGVCVERTGRTCRVHPGRSPVRRISLEGSIPWLPTAITTTGAM